MAESIKYKTIIFIGVILFSFFTGSSLVAEELPDFLIRLNKYYGETFTIIDSNTIQWNDGVISVLDDGLHKTAEEMINSGDIEDQFSMKYTPGEMSIPPASEIDDPGRVRNNQFFKKLYGNTPEGVEANLKELQWMPNFTDTILLFNTKYGAWDSLKCVSDELENMDKELLKYVTMTAGTYYWRVIKDTERLSTHSFGIAIDINVEYSSYWKWDREYKYKNSIPFEIIRIFEDNGFIWGGKWYHYDTMHFEYRPELF